MQVRKNNLEIQLYPFGHYFSVLKLEKQLDHTVFQLKAGREESFITSGSEQGLSQGTAMSPLWLLQGLQDLSQGEHMELCQGSCPLSPCHSSPP